jgi:hypothetical protein
MEDEKSNGASKPTGFLTGLGVTLTSAFLGTSLLLYLAAFTQHSFFWMVVIIAGVLPSLGIYLTVKWSRQGKKSKANGAMVAIVIGIVIAGGTVWWFISFLNSLGG